MQAREYIRVLKTPNPHMRAWGLGGEAAPLDVVLQMQEVRAHPGAGSLALLCQVDMICCSTAAQ